MTANEDLIHVKLEYDEAVQSKKDVLSTEMNLLRLAQIIKKYKSLRIEELKTKLKAYQKFKEIVLSINKLKKTLPRLELPDILEDESKRELTEVEKRIKHTREKQTDKSIEAQLQEIQDRLSNLG